MSQSALCISNTWTASALPHCRVTAGDVFKFISLRRSSSCQWEICSFVINQVTDSEGSSKRFMPTRGKNLSGNKKMQIHSLKEELIMLKQLHELSVFSEEEMLPSSPRCRYQRANWNTHFTSTSGVFSCFFQLYQHKACQMLRSDTETCPKLQTVERD